MQNTNLKDAVSYLKTKGTKYEINETTTGQIWLGVFGGRSVWYWFATLEGDDTQALYFKHAYSTKTGREMGGTNASLKAWDLLGAYDEPETPAPVEMNAGTTAAPAQPEAGAEKKSLAEIEEAAVALIEEHGLSAAGWVFEWNGRKRAAGICNYSLKVIGLSKHYAKAREWKNTLNTILHEIAHALAGPNAGHGPEWQKVARSIGCDAKRCFSDYSAVNIARYKGSCGCGENQHALTRRPRVGMRYDCTDCKKAGRPSRIVWHDSKAATHTAQKEAEAPKVAPMQQPAKSGPQMSAKHPIDAIIESGLPIGQRAFLLITKHGFTYPSAALYLGVNKNQISGAFFRTKNNPAAVGAALAAYDDLLAALS